MATQDASKPSPQSSDDPADFLNMPDSDRIAIMQQLIEQTPQGHPDLSEYQNFLGIAFGKRYRTSGNLNDHAAALQHCQKAVDLAPEGHPDRVRYLECLAISFRDRHRRLGDLQDLESALKHEQEVVDLTPEGHPDRARHLKSLGESFQKRYERLGDLRDFEAGVQIGKQAVELIPQGDPNRGEYLYSLAVSFTRRYQRLGGLQDLEAALQMHKEAVDLTPEGNQNRAEHMQGLGVCFGIRFQRLGDLQDLQAALQNYQESVNLTPEGHPSRAGRLESLAISFAERYKRLGDLQDLQVALQHAQQAVGWTPKRHPDRAVCLFTLAISFSHRYIRLGDLRDLEASLRNNQEVVELTPEEHPHRAIRLQNLAVSYRSRYERLGDLQDLDAALQMEKEAVYLRPSGHPDRPAHLRRLGVTFTLRYQRLSDLHDLDAALQMRKEAVDLTPEGHPDRAICLQSLAGSLHHQYMVLGNPEDLKTTHTCYSQSFQNIQTSDPEYSWGAALKWASIAEQSDPSYCAPAYTAAFQLLPEILWIGHSISARQEAIHRLKISQATANAARTLINLSNLTSTVEIMEQGLATTFQQMLQLKADVDKLKPADAQKFQTLSSELYGGTSSNPISVVSERNKLLEDIRKQPGLKYFLLPRPYSALCKASQGGPVVILNSHKTSCDGIIIPNPTSSPVHVVFPDITLELLESQKTMLQDLLGHCNVRSRGESPSSRLFGHKELFLSKTSEECFMDLLTFLWTHIVGPVYQALELLGIHNGRIWWLPTGAFTRLPLHACPPTDQFIHSYTATLGSLLDANNRKLSLIKQQIGIVGVTHTGPAWMKYLGGVEQEVKKIQSIVKNSPVQCLKGQQATVDAVKLQLQNCSWVHLACHGKQDLIDPTKSHLQLYGGILELETILRVPLSNAQVVFLAACQTAMGDAQLVNESFHLGGGFLAAGFRGAIGTLWVMNDLDGPLVAEIVYSHIFRGGQQPRATDAAEALHLAVQELKRRKIPYERWIPFIHMGV
ncbi:CHAT domain-containing protein [Mycena vulgaris]|nr:CHAT domain-containing protein [Mycena vulgaris]